jgi:micrococcal nuclease
MNVGNREAKEDLYSKPTGRMKALYWLLFLFISGHAFASNDGFVTKVIKVIDGNTFEIIGSDGQPQTLVLFGIDSPEPGQPYADKAKRTLEKLILDKRVDVQMQGRNRFGNYLAVITIVKNDKDPRIELLEEGMAWTAEKNPVAELEAVRVKAAQKSKGLWQDENPTPPWTYRREQSMLQAKSS